MQIYDNDIIISRSGSKSFKKSTYTNFNKHITFEEYTLETNYCFRKKKKTALL